MPLQTTLDSFVALESGSRLLSSRGGSQQQRRAARAAAQGRPPRQYRKFEFPELLVEQTGVPAQE